MSKEINLNGSSDGIVVRGAREHNLKSINVHIPRNKITVVTGLSGSGKSSLAFDTIYAEGQRRYVESLSAYARSFIEQMKKPDVDSIAGLQPSIAIDQKSISNNPRSTVGTVSEVYDYLRLLYARIGMPRCPKHNVEVDSQSPAEIAAEILSRPKGSKFLMLAPVYRGKKGEMAAEFHKWARRGFTRARVDGQWVELKDPQKLARHKAHDIDLLVDRLVADESQEHRLKQSLNLALSLANGQVLIETLSGASQMYSIHSACPQCGFSFPEIEPRFFSFNNPRGYCPTCKGLGSLEFEEFEETVTLGRADLARSVNELRWKFKDKKLSALESEDDEAEIDEYALKKCPSCLGARLRQEALNVYLGDVNIAQAAQMTLDELIEFLTRLKLNAKSSLIGEKILQQIFLRLEYLQRVGTGYLSLDRPTRTLSGGEAQRIRLATQVGSGLIGVLYVLDEPSIGLHPRDHHRLLEILREIRDRGNTVLMVEHDEDTMRDADHLIDMGPRAGRLGGEVIAQGTPEHVAADPKSMTGAYLSKRLFIETPQSRRRGSGETLKLLGACGNNLKNIDISLPLGSLIGVTGVSGSGKSTLIIDTLYRKLANHFYKSKLQPAPFQKVEGLEFLDKVIDINQKPIGRTPRSVPATYVGLFPMIRDLFSQLPEAKVRGYKPGHFSFNVKGGRCENCQGAGHIRVAMHFLSDVFVKCEVCQGHRYSREILNVRFKEKSVADVLEMTVAEALDFFKSHRTIFKKLETLHRVGLDYMTLGQSSTTLSGGEAQRIKLSRELSKKGTGRTLYILDEPTTGLHFEDIRRLVDLLQELVDQGNTVIVIEHQMDVIKCCDLILDLGPEGGRGGGEIMGVGTPEEIVKKANSETARYLEPFLKNVTI